VAAVLYLINVTWLRSLLGNDFMPSRAFMPALTFCDYPLDFLLPPRAFATMPFLAAPYRPPVLCAFVLPVHLYCRLVVTCWRCHCSTGILLSGDWFSAYSAIFLCWWHTDADSAYAASRRYNTAPPIDYNRAMILPRDATPHHHYLDVPACLPALWRYYCRGSMIMSLFVSASVRWLYLCATGASSNTAIRRLWCSGGDVPYHTHRLLPCSTPILLPISTTTFLLPSVRLLPLPPSLPDDSHHLPGAACCIYGRCQHFDIYSLFFMNGQITDFDCDGYTIRRCTWIGTDSHTLPYCRFIPFAGEFVPMVRTRNTGIYLLLPFTTTIIRYAHALPLPAIRCCSAADYLTLCRFTYLPAVLPTAELPYRDSRPLLLLPAVARLLFSWWDGVRDYAGGFSVTAANSAWRTILPPYIGSNLLWFLYRFTLYSTAYPQHLYRCLYNYYVISITVGSFTLAGALPYDAHAPIACLLTALSLPTVWYKRLNYRTATFPEHRLHLPLHSSTVYVTILLADTFLNEHVIPRCLRVVFLI